MSRLLAVAAASILVIPIPSSAQEDGIPRMADGRPDLRGVWQALNTAVWNIEDHPAELGIPAGRSIVVGGKLPYLPSA